MGLCLNLQGWRFHYLSGLLSQWETTVVVKATIPGQMFPSSPLSSTALVFWCLFVRVWVSIFGLTQLLCPADLTSSSSGVILGRALPGPVHWRCCLKMRLRAPFLPKQHDILKVSLALICVCSIERESCPK